MRSTVLFTVLSAAVLVAVADVAYPNNPECGWGDQTYRAVGDWAQDAGSGQNWDPAESKGVMTPTHNKPCEYQAVVRGLQPGKTYNWKVTISGERTGWATQWGCTGYNNPPACTFQADSTGGVTFTIIASYAYPLSTSAAPSSSNNGGSTNNGGGGNNNGGNGGSSSGPIDDGFDRNGGDIDQKTASNKQGCQALCVANPSCDSWSFDTCGNSCWLKKGLPAKGSMNCRSSGTINGRGGNGGGSNNGGSSNNGGGGNGGNNNGGNGGNNNGNGKKKVFAHYMMGYAYSSDGNFFANTINTAKSVGIDGFAVNVGTDGWQPDKMQVFLDAAKGKDFYLFVSLDMNEIHDVGVMSNWVNRFADHPSYFRYNGRPFVSTFSGQDANVNWQDWKSNNVGSKNIYFCPNFFGDLAGMYDKFPVIDCLFSWDAWQKDVSNSRDVPAINAGHSKGKTYMAGVAPWFYCHLPQWGKNWFWPQGPDNGAANIWSIRWRQAIASNADFVEIITWNDYSESSYIAPLSSEVPDFTTAYVNGMDHSAFLKMTAYYTAYFKTGNPPQIKKNGVYFWYRIHGKNEQRNDGAGKPTMYWSNPEDCVSVHTIGTTGGTVHVNIGGRDTSFAITQQEQDACIPYNGQGQVRVRVEKGGQTFTGDNGPDIQGGGNGYNFNVWTGSIEY